MSYPTFYILDPETGFSSVVTPLDGIRRKGQREKCIRARGSEVRIWLAPPFKYFHSPTWTPRI